MLFPLFAQEFPVVRGIVVFIVCLLLFWPVVWFHVFAIGMLLRFLRSEKRRDRQDSGKWTPDAVDDHSLAEDMLDDRFTKGGAE